MNLTRTMLCFTAACSTSLLSDAANPFLPLWEHIPDGEPYIFDDPDHPGKQRVYLYGSHDMLRTEYCGTDLVLWSAPVDSLDKWRYDGVILEVKTDAAGGELNAGGRPDVLYAPDVAMRELPDGKKEYYLYPNNQGGGRNGMVARSDRPDGPFEIINWNPQKPDETIGVLAFDPAVFIDDDGRVYGYWGFRESYGAELDPVTMATVKPGTEIVSNMVSGHQQEGVFRFFEASSIRKIKDKYVFIYSRFSEDGEWGLPTSNYNLAYAYSNNPLGPFTYGGTIIDARGRDFDADGKPMATATPSGNTHGSIIEIGGRWWVFYHRQSGSDEFARQAMVAPIEVSVTPGPDGKVVISEAEFTSEGFEIGGLDPFKKYPAAIASHLTGPTPAVLEYPFMHYSGSYFQPSYVDDHAIADPYNPSVNFSPVVNNTAGSILGYKYYDFDRIGGNGELELVLDIIPGDVEGEINVYLKAPWRGDKSSVGVFKLSPDKDKSPRSISASISLPDGVAGKRPLYLEFASAEKGVSLCTLHHLQFRRR